MITFADSSALVAELVGEPGAPALAGAVAVSMLARVEVLSALERRRRAGADAAASGVLADAFARRCAGGEGAFAVVIPIAEPVVVGAEHLLRAHPLRSLDAVQLSTACTVRDAADVEVRFAALDDRLRSAAAAEGFALLPA